jgi:hypothetical protein
MAAGTYWTVVTQVRAASQIKLNHVSSPALPRDIISFLPHTAIPPAKSTPPHNRNRPPSCATASQCRTRNADYDTPLTERSHGVARFTNCQRLVSNCWTWRSWLCMTREWAWELCVRCLGGWGSVEWVRGREGGV